MAERNVIIVGAGPSGMTLALVLGRKGVPVTLLERGAELGTFSRASTVHPATLELLDELGVAWEVIEAGRMIHKVQYRDRERGVIAEFTLDSIKDFTKFPIRMQTDQSDITRIIRKQLVKLPSVRLLFDRTVTGVEQDENGVRVTAEGGNGTEVFEGDFVVGADGAHSSVRELAGITFTSEAYEKRYMMVMTDYDVLTNMPDMAEVTYVFDGYEGVGFLALPDHMRIVFHLQPGEDQSEATKPENVQRRLRGFLPPQDEEYPVRDVLVYTLYRAVADTMRVGRVLLAGDSAHLNNPSGGMGMNSGIQDGYVLGKALVGLLKGEVGEAVLDAYAGGRRNVALGYIQERADQYSKDQTASDVSFRDARDARLRNEAGTPERMRHFLLKASMFDSAPRVQW